MTERCEGRRRAPRGVRGAGRLLGRVVRGPVGAVAGWALLAPSATVAVARLSRRETRTSVLMLEALTPLLAAPALAAVVAAVATRRRAMTVGAGALLLCHVVWAAPDLRPARPLPEGVDGAPRLRVFSANILFTNTDMGGIAAEIRAADPDVVALQEVSPFNLSGLEAEGLLADYPHRWVDARPDTLGTAILSRLPLEDAGQWRAGRLPMARATVVLGPHRLRLYDVHARAPFGPGGPAEWERQLAALRQVAEQETEALVLAGDFNATTGHRSFRRLLAAGLRDAHLERGRRFVATWPLDMRPLPPLVQLDRVLVSDHLAVLDVREGTGRGSDHRPVVVDLAVVG